MRIYIKITTAIILIVSQSCNSSSKQELFYDGVIDALENSNRLIERSSQEIYAGFQGKLQDPVSSYKAEIWFPKALQALSLRKEYCILIDSFKTKINKQNRIREKEIRMLASNMFQYKVNLLKIDSSLALEFKDYILPGFELTAITPEKFIDSVTNSFSTRSKKSAMASILQILNQVNALENKTIQYCINKVPIYGDFYQTYSAFFGQNSTIFSPGEKLIITSGVGTFSRKAKPEILINKNEVDINDEGYAEKIIVVSQKPGIYSIPVEVSFTDEYGKRQTMKKIIHYKVKK